MRLALLVLILLFPAVVFSQTLRNQLETVNAEWKKYPAGTSLPAQQFTSDRQLIQAHLTHTIKLLWQRKFPLSNDPKTVMRRKNLLHILQAYCDSGIFPQNNTIPGRIPVFIDEQGTHCAVGYLMLKSGAGDLAKKVARTQNNIYIRQITDPAFFAWQAHSGFTVDELALIQPSYYNPVVIEERQPVAPQCGSGVFTQYNYQWINSGNESPKPPLKWQGNCNEKGQLHGRWVQFYRNGEKFVEGWFKNGVRDSVWRIYFQGNSLIEEVKWENGKKNGTYIRYSTPGILAEKGAFENDLKTGQWSIWHVNMLRSQGNYLNGKKNGKWLQYYQTQDSIPQVYSEEWFDEGVMKNRKLFQYKYSNPYQLYEHVHDSLYYFQNLMRSDIVQEEGHLYLYTQLQPVLYDYEYTPHIDLVKIYASNEVPFGFQAVEKTVRTGKWVVRGNTIATRISEYQADSAWIYVQRDSVTGADIYKSPKHISFECLPSPYRLSDSYSVVPPLSLTSKNTWENGRITEQNFYTKTGMVYLQLRFNSEAKLVSGSRYDVVSKQTVIWSEAHAQSDVPMHMTIKTVAWKTLCYGGMLDTATRHGQWEFYDSRSNVYAKGSYNRNQRSGPWEETDTLTGVVMRGNYVNDIRSGLWKEVEPVSGNVWMGKYAAGKRKGLWVLQNPQGEIIERKKY
ncbi:MAG: hypothetical protein MUC87_12945 [Bacteroidia bacterium]|jgi:antitoxin component YwqK of YwqJK toxin-antitoxin module|nr:hypothetical protein [Bacteroidia bacterium]